MAESITKDQLKQEQDQFVIIDVREPDEVANGAIENSQNMPLGLVIRNAKKGQIDDLKEKKICVYCASGYRGSSNTIKKAEKLVANGGVVKIEDDLFQVKSSSDPSKSYFVTSDSCECPGFKNFYKFHHGKGLKANCSHLEAIRIFLKENK